MQYSFPVASILNFQKSEVVIFISNIYFSGELETNIKLEARRGEKKNYPSTSFMIGCSKQYQVLVIVGEPGCGKTTEIPQYLHEAGYTMDGKKKIGISLPRGIAHVMPDVAAKVAEEMGVQLGHEIQYMHTLEDGYELVDLVVTQTLVLHVMEAPGDILVFLPAQQEIETFDHSLKQIIIAHGHTQLITCPISAEVLEPTPQGVRKVVLATSPAEISWLMLNSIQYFIDSGLCKMKSYDLMAGKELDRMSPVSKAEATQRAELGLAGSTCYRYGFVDPPAPEALAQALQQLIRRGVLDNDLGELTQVGNQMADTVSLSM
ncbi:hypothetical protein ACFXTH_026636 [Malus domestica]